MLTFSFCLTMSAPVAYCADPPAKIFVEPLRDQADLVKPEHLVNAAGVMTHFRQSGVAGENPEVILLHGFGSSTFTWRKNLEPLGRFAHVTAMDIRGFGLTEKPKDGRYHETEYVRHVLATMDALKIRSAVLIGSSMGGAIAARIALEHPERVCGLILVDAARPYAKLDFEAAGVNPSLFQRKANPLSIAMVRTLLNRDQITRMLKSVYEDREPVTDEMVDAYYLPTIMNGSPEAILSMLNPPEETIKPIPINRIKCPVAILWGQKDNVIPLQAGEKLARDIPDSEFTVWSGAGHLPHEDRPEDFHRLVESFLKKRVIQSGDKPCK
ncbi:MAG: hypothetical protein RJA81_1206 [Planctomycetota bacterium]|jgi:pimeloyl-ACP methyl ester carboxylesterase